MDIPTFRYMTDAEKFLKTISKEVDENSQIMKKTQKMLASTFAGMRLMAASGPRDVSGTPDGQRKLVRQLKHKIDPDLQKVVVPNMQKLQKQYVLAEDFYEKLKGVEQAEAQIQQTFKDRRGPEYEALMTQFRVLKDKISTALKDCLQFLADVANKHVPESFQKYIDYVVEQLNDSAICRDSQTFMYVSLDDKGNLVFTAYIMMIEVTNDEGQVAPQLYVSIQWITDKPTAYVDLNHEYEVPSKLLGHGEAVESVGDAGKAIKHLLEVENYSTVIGVVPLALLMNVDPSTIDVTRFKPALLIDDVKVDEAKHTFTFIFKPEMTKPKSVTEACAAIYLQLKGLLKKNGAVVKMLPKVGAHPAEVTFLVTKPAEGGEFNNYDWEFLRDRFGLNNTQMRKIGYILNQPKPEEKDK